VSTDIASPDGIRFNGHFDDLGRSVIFKQACKLGNEGSSISGGILAIGRVAAKAA
jgi:hypothetical protein